MASQRPSHIPVPSSPLPAHFSSPQAPPSPSAFPALPHSDDHAHSPLIPAPPTGIPSYAQTSRKTLPPSKAPEGISVPATALPPKPPLVASHSRDRLQPSQNGKDSPYARPPQQGANGAAGRAKKTSTSTRGAAAVRRAPGGLAKDSSAEESATEKKDRPRTVPGMPASMLPPPVPKKKHAHGRTKSDASAKGGMTASASTPNLAAAANGEHGENGLAINKKRRASLRKVLPPGNSRLSALAPTFDFVPRSATTPNLSSYSSSAGEDDSALSTDEGPSPPHPSADTPTSGALTPSFRELSIEAEDEVAGESDINSEAPPPPPAASSSSSHPSSAAPSSPVLEVVTPAEQQKICETVASAGAQGDEFRSVGFSSADAKGAKEVAGQAAGEQSASPSKPTSAGSASEGAAFGGEKTTKQEEEQEDADAVEPEAERTDRSLASFLPSAFAVSSPSAFAPLSLPVESSSPAAQEQPQPEVVTIPTAVHDSPLADLAYTEKKGWWSADYKWEYTGPLEIESAEPAASTSKKIPAAAESQQEKDETVPEVLLKLPAWVAPKQDEGDETLVRDSAPASGASTPLSTFLPTAFTDSLAAPSSSSSSASLPTFAAAAAASLSNSSSSAPTAAASPSLSSYLATSFAPLSTPSFAPLDQLRAEELAKGAREDVEIPTSAEEVANLPSTAEVLEVDAREAERAEERVGEEKKRKEEKKGWWSADYSATPSALAASSSSPATFSNAPLSASEQQKASETVRSAGAQADGFVARGFEETDREGARESEGAKAGEQSVSPESGSAGKAVAVEAESASTEKKSSSSSTSALTFTPDSSTPQLGSFLSTSFSTTSVPSPSSFPSSSDSQVEQRFTNPALTASTVRAAGAQGDQYRGKGFTEADREGVVEDKSYEAAETPTEGEGERKGSNALGTYLTTHFAAESSSQEVVEGTESTSSAPAAKHDAQDAEEDDKKPSPPSSGDKDAPSLTLALSAAWQTAPWPRKLWAVIASTAINVGLPFVNGVMLGFGELFARNVLGVRLGWPLHSSSPSVPASHGRANTSGVGLRNAGTRIGTEVPGHAGAKTAVEAVVENAV